MTASTNRVWQVLAVVALALAGSSRVARACVRLGPQPHVVAPDPADTTPPSPPIVTSLGTGVYGGGDDGGCGHAKGDCGATGFIGLELELVDDVTTPDAIGCHVRVVGGTPPAGLELFDHSPIFGESYPDGLAACHSLVFEYASDAAGYSFDLEVRAVDLAGNIGPPAVVTIAGTPPPADGGGCASGEGRQGPAIALLTLGLATRRRRPRC